MTKSHIGLGKTLISITLGDGVSLSITEDDQLIVEDAFIRMSLGKATHKRFIHLISYINRLSIHAVD